MLVLNKQTKLYNAKNFMPVYFVPFILNIMQHFIFHITAHCQMTKMTHYDAYQDDVPEDLLAASLKD